MTIDDPTLKARTAAGAGDASGKLKTPGSKAPDRRRASGIGGWLKRHRRLTLIAGAVIIAGAAFQFLIAPKLFGDGGHKYVTAIVARGDIENTVTAVGNVQPKNYVDVGAQVSGQIKTLKVNIGDTVNKGDLLAEIDAQVQAARVEQDKDNLTSLQAQLVDKQAQLVLKKAQYQREVRLDKDNATSKDNLQSAKAAYDSQSAQIDALQAQINQAQSSLHADQVTLGYATITAPMDGTVVSLSARLGQTLVSIQQAPTILRIADLSLMQILTQVSEADVAKLKVGMPAYFTTLGNPDRRYTSTLEQIQPTPETVNNVILYDVLSDVPNTDGSLMTQMTAQSFFVTASAKDVLMVPVAAVEPLTGRGGARQGGGGFRAGASGSFGGQRQGGGPASGQPMQAPAGAGAGAALSPPQGSAGEASGQGRRPGGHGGFAAHHGFVQVMNESGKIERRMVETGVTDRVNIEIKSGLKEGDKVIVGEAQKPAKPAAAAAPGARGGGRPPFGFAP